MRHDKYRYNNTEEVVYYLKKYQRVKRSGRQISMMPTADTC